MYDNLDHQKTVMHVLSTTLYLALFRIVRSCGWPVLIEFDL